MRESIAPDGIHHGHAALPAEVRDPLVRLCGWVIASGSTAIIFVSAARAGWSFLFSNMLPLLVCLSTVATLVAVIARGVPAFWHGVVLIAHMALLTGTGLAYNGFTPGTAAWLTMLIVFVDIVIGVRAMVAVFAASIAAVSVVGMCWHRGWLPLETPLSSGRMGALEPSMWLRQGVAAITGAAATVAVVHLLKRRLLDFSEQQRAIVQTLAEEQQRRAQAEVERLQVENRSQLAAQQNAERLRAVFRAAPIAITLLRDGKVAEVNQHLVDMVGHPREALIGRDTAVLYGDAAEYEQVRQSVVAALQREGVWDGELTLRHRNGTPVDCLVRIAPLEPHSLEAGSVAMLFDIRDRKRAAELLQAKAQAEAANRAKSAFLANMSHEIRTPMNAILGFSQLMLRDASLSPAQREYLQIIGRNGEHLLALINDVLDMSKIEAHRIVLRPATFDLHTFVRDLEVMFAGRARDKGLAFTVERAPDLPVAVIADQGRLRQIFVNLIANAVKFTAHGHVVTRVSVRAIPDGSWRLVAEIEDTGPGIAPEELSRLFRHFEQTAAGRYSGGTGLGLAISRELARLMGGDVTAESTLGRGSTFRLDVALGVTHVPLLAEGAREPRRIGRLAPDQPTCRVLIVDDVDDNRRLLTEMLRATGFEVAEAAHGAAAVEEFGRWQPHGILMDLRMPVMDGNEATMRIRALPGGSRVKIISLSASVFTENREQMLAAGADDFLGKPFREDQLLEKLGRLLSLRFTEGELRAAAPEDPGSPARLDGSTRPLPVHLVTALRQALDSADLDRAMEMIGLIARHDARLADELRARTEAFHYEEAISLLAQARIEPDLP